MPRFSVVVPVHDVEEFLPECLDSILSQDFRDFEIVAVEDHSPDACGQIIDEYAARDPRVHSFHLKENMGPGPARNVGMSRSVGDYLLFLDGDDTLTANSLQAMVDRLNEADGPDVLLYDFARTYWTGEVVRNPLSGHLRQSGPQEFSIDDRPELLRLSTIPCNKAYRRDFIENERIEFPSGLYEEIPWTYLVMLAARSIAVLDRVCLHYRQRRHGSVTSTPSHRHLEMFDQFDRVFSFLSRNPQLDRWRPLVFEQMLPFLVSAFNDPKRLPSSARSEFIQRCGAACLRYAPIRQV
ncbi:glycosyltransferase family 2 protein [Streptomyces sp. NPDC050658]|uniref:glycosyltransferase family 2 protein n=1 Tax=unclassified Streptomyces TaxID=2593676 RepID=UPI003446AC25